MTGGNESGGAGARAAGAGGGAILDKKGGNVPRVTHLTGKHYRARSKIRDAMRWWRRHGMALWWCTLTSAPGAEPDRLRKDFQAWRKRLVRAHGLELEQVQYVMVDTGEGHGVLHFVLAIPKESKGPWKYQIDYTVCGEWWGDIHGARQVKFLLIGEGEGDTRRLSQYLVSQYMVSQGGETVDLLGRISSSRFRVSFARLRKALFSRCASRIRAYEILHAMGPLGDAFEQTWKEVRKGQYAVARQAWAQLLELGSVRWCGVQLVVENGHLVEI